MAFGRLFKMAGGRRLVFLNSKLYQEVNVRHLAKFRADRIIKAAGS